MSWEKVHLSVTDDPTRPITALCGKDVPNPERVPLTTDQRSILERKDICASCRKTVEANFPDGTVWESGFVAGQEAFDGAA